MKDERPFDIITKEVRIDLNTSIFVVVNNRSRTVEFIKCDDVEHEERSEQLLVSMHIDEAKIVRDFLLFSLWKR